jgi:hypothetical protein
MKKYLFLIITLIPTLVMAASATYDGNATVTSKEYWGDVSPALPPLDTSYLWARKNGDGIGTHELVSLIFEQQATSSYTYPWNFYAETTLNNNYGEGVGVNSRLYNNANGWSSSVHAESIVKGTGTNIGINSETSPLTGFSGRSIAFVANAKDGYGAVHPHIWSETAYDIVNDSTVGFVDGLKVDNNATVINAVHIKSSANATFGFINESANTDVALYTGPAPTALRMDAYGKICFENTDRICMVYGSATQKIYFKNGTDTLGYIDTSIKSAKCLNC